MTNVLLNRIQRKLLQLRLQPIRVYCIHHVSEEYDPLTMWECDWMEIEQFKQNILHLKEQYTFISLPKAYEKLQHDTIRCNKYAVLTADDGYKSILNILPWLAEQKIPITLFVNTKYQNGKSWSEINEEQARRAMLDVDMVKDVCPNLYLTKEELRQVAAMPNVTIGMHGHEHLDATKQTIDGFKENVKKCSEALKDVPQTILYFAYPWGRHNTETDKVLEEMRLIPVMMDGNMNYNNASIIHRELIDK